jgi:hypothetical protein
MNESSKSTTGRASEPGACEGEGEDEVDTTHFGCWGMLVGQPLCD